MTVKRKFEFRIGLKKFHYSAACGVQRAEFSVQRPPLSFVPDFVDNTAVSTMQGLIWEPLLKIRLNST